MKDFESVSKFLQKDSTTLGSARAQFEGLLENYRHMYPCIKKYLELSYSSSFLFESAVLKVQGGLAEEAKLLPAEKNQLHLSGFLNEDSSPVAVDISTEDESTLSFAEKIEQRRKIRVVENNKSSSYKSTLHVLPDSNVCERLFSLSKSILGDRRRRMTVKNLNMLLVLKVNKSFWDINTVQKVLIQASPTTYNAEENEFITTNIFDNRLVENLPDEDGDNIVEYDEN